MGILTLLEFSPVNKRVASMRLQVAGEKLNINYDNANIDPDGRFLIINILIYNIGFCIVSFYGPNADDPSFFHTFFLSLSMHGNTTL